MTFPRDTEFVMQFGATGFKVFYNRTLGYWCVTIAQPNVVPFTTELIRFMPEYSTNDWNLEDAAYNGIREFVADFSLAADPFDRHESYFKNPHRDLL